MSRTDATSDGAFYSSPITALMLANLAIPPEWTDSDQLASLRIIDPACGDGALLWGCMETIRRRTDPADWPDMHHRLCMDVLHGLDIESTEVERAADRLRDGADIARSDMNLVTLPHGVIDGQAHAGALELLVPLAPPLPFEPHGFDLVIMNPPFTNNQLRNRKMSPEHKQLMQQRELDIRESLRETDSEAAAVITANAIATFFTPLADRLASDRLALIRPTTFATGASGNAERRFLAERFHIERIVTTHDPKRIAFSENTSIHETLQICRRHPSPSAETSPKSTLDSPE